MRRAAATALAAALLATLAAGCGGGRSATTAAGESAGAFMTGILRDEIDGRWSAQWSELHPGHQRLITRAEYVACSKRMGTDLATGREVLIVRGVRDQAIHVRGIPERTAKLVTIELRRPGSGSMTYRLHAVRHEGRWTWILGAPFLDALARGRCLDGTPLAPPA